MTSADILITNARILTMDAEQPRAEALAIKGNRILRVGSKHDVTGLKAKHTRVIDAQMKTVIPGIIEGHVHLFGGGVELDTLGVQVGHRGAGCLQPFQLPTHRHHHRRSAAWRERGLVEHQRGQCATPPGRTHGTGVTRKPRYMAITAKTAEAAPPPASMALLPFAFWCTSAPAPDRSTASTLSSIHGCCRSSRGRANTFHRPVTTATP